MRGVLVMFCMVFIRVVVSKENFHLFGGSFCLGVAGEVSDLSRGAGLLLFGKRAPTSPPAHTKLPNTENTFQI